MANNPNVLKNLKPFVKGDPRINRKGAPKRGQNWSEVWKRLTDMTRDELIAYIGEKNKLAKLLKELPPDIPIKDGLAIITMIHYGREPNARMLAAIMDREDGKPPQALDLSNSDGSLTWAKFIENANRSTSNKQSE